MVKRRVKKRTHVGAPGVNQAPGQAQQQSGSRIPKSMVIRIGASQLGPSISQLVYDVRSIFEPHTAARLKERRNNKLRDYTTMAGPLGISHLMLFSRSEGKGNVQLRLCVTPRGPTLTFRVEKYSLCKDITKSQKRPRAGIKEEFLNPPLLVMNNFASKEEEPVSKDGNERTKPRIPKQLENLTTTVFQSLFPPLNPTATPLNGIKRVLLFDRSAQSPETENPEYCLNLRHYAIETRTAKSVPKPLRKLDHAQKLARAGSKRKRSGMPNLGQLDDVADYLLDPHAADGFTSGSESELDTDAEVEVYTDAAQKISERKRRQQQQREQENGEQDERPAQAQTRSSASREDNVQKKAIKLHELGPRMRLRLTKVEEGLCSGKVMWHEYIHKTKAEQAELEKRHQKAKAEKDRRRAEQKANVERKRAERRARGEPEVQEGDEADEDEVAILSDADDDVWQDEDVDEYDEAGDAEEDQEMADLDSQSEE
ncbi:Brix-domain-containing protein [Polychaeton citri CBS 116435]|uniref:Brix-domain-containing protein n=1 Tax=Polychaeton citri CBS 116435 TaxID=1314669 RepID=A0A9P4QHQ8_9PEZI|nr:Brix-domain-containing protein [Polychaeton citri CBS 116435]